MAEYEFKQLSEELGNLQAFKTKLKARVSQHSQQTV